ncbi:MAG: C40 family peptidase [Flavobacteriales bacterium]
MLFVLLFLTSVAGWSASASGHPTPQVETAALQPYSLESIITYARTMLGTPYRYGGMTRRGIDCSGLMNVVFEAHGLDLARSAYAIDQQCERIELGQLQAGDFLFFKGRNTRSSRIGHIALVTGVDSLTGNITMIHATNRGVVEDVYQEESYYLKRYLHAGRMVDFDALERLSEVIPTLGTGLLLRM